MNSHSQQTNTGSTTAPDEAAREIHGDEVTGLPGLSTWGKVYLFVFIVFSVYVVLLTLLSKVFA